MWTRDLWKVLVPTAWIWAPVNSLYINMLTRVHSHVSLAPLQYWWATNPRGQHRQPFYPWWTLSCHASPDASVLVLLLLSWWTLAIYAVPVHHLTQQQQHAFTKLNTTQTTMSFAQHCCSFYSFNFVLFLFCMCACVCVYVSECVVVYVNTPY
jgi:hypothetical protein